MSEPSSGGRSSLAQIEEMAALCRAKLRPSITLTGQLLIETTRASETLLARMNDVLGAVVESNFGVATYDHLHRLYESIQQLQPELIDKCENLALYYFARSLAVVLEEAVRKNEERLANREREQWGGAIEGYGREEYGSEEVKKEEAVDGYGRGAEYCSEEETKEEAEEAEEYGIEKKEDEEGDAAAMTEYGSEDRGTVVEPAEHGSCSSPEPCLPLSLPDSPSLSEPISGGRSSPFDQIEEEEESLSPTWPQSRLPEEWRGRSEEQIEGLLTIQGVSPLIGRKELVSFLEIMGPVAELRHYPEWDGWPTGFAVCRFESEEAACAAQKRLHLKRFFGTRLHLARVHALPKTATRDHASAAAAETHATGADAPSPTDTHTVIDDDGDTVSSWGSEIDTADTATVPYRTNEWDDEVD